MYFPFLKPSEPAPHFVPDHSVLKEILPEADATPPRGKEVKQYRLQVTVQSKLGLVQ